MGLVIKISAYGRWERTYFVQSMDEQEAKERAFKMFKQTAGCYLPNTLEEADEDDGFYVEVVAEVEQIIL